MDTFTIPAKWLSAKWIALYLVLIFAGMFLLSGILHKISDSSAYRGCVSDLHSQIKLPSDWRIQTCEPGDWSMDFESEVLVPSGKDSIHIIDEFSRLNPRAGAPVDSSLTIEPVREKVYLIRLVNSK